MTAKYIGLTNILKDSPRYFIDKNYNLTDNENKAFKFTTIGEAMKACSLVNERLGKCALKVMEVYM